MIFEINGQHSDKQDTTFKLYFIDSDDGPGLTLIVDEIKRTPIAGGQVAKETKSLVEYCRIKKSDLKRIAKAL